MGRPDNWLGVYFEDMRLGGHVGQRSLLSDFAG